MTSLKKAFMIACAVTLTALLPSFGFAAPSPGEAVPAATTNERVQEHKEIIYYDILQRDTPRGTVEGFLSAVHSRDYALAAQYLDLRNLPADEVEEQGPVLARQLRFVLDRNIKINPANINDTYEGNRDDGLPAWQEIVGVIKTEDKVYEIFLKRKFMDDGASLWLFSDQTVRAIPEMYSHFGLGVLGKYMPEKLFEYMFFGITAAGWIAVIIIALVLFLAIFILTQPLYFLARRFKLAALEQFLGVMLWPARWVFVTVVTNHISGKIAFTEAARSLSEAKTLVTVAWIWLLVRVCEYFFVRWRQILTDSGQDAQAVLVALVQKLALISVVFVGIAIYLENLGFKVSTIIAGLGVGGVAVALASQKSIEDLFGAVTLLSSSPIKAGDFIRLEGGQVGTVEEIGMRFTKIRTLQRTILNIPNSKIAGMHLENFNKRDKFLYNPEIGLRLDTTASQVRYVLLETRKMFYAHPKVHVTPVRIRLKEFSPYAMILAVFLYIKANDYDESLAVAEDLNFRIMAILEKAGVQMAYPTQTLIGEQGLPPDIKKAEQIENEVEQLGKEGKLFITDFPYDEIKKLHNTITYPPDRPENTAGE